MISQQHKMRVVILLDVVLAPHLLVGDLQQVQHHSMSPHVLQKPLLLHTTLLARVTQLTEPHQDLQMRHAHFIDNYRTKRHLTIIIRR